MTNCFTWKLFGCFNWKFLKRHSSNTWWLLHIAYIPHEFHYLSYYFFDVGAVLFDLLKNSTNKILMTTYFQHVSFAFIRMISMLCWIIFVMESPWVEWLYNNLKDSFLFYESLWKSNTIHNSRNIKNRMRSLVVFKCWNEMKQKQLLFALLVVHIFIEFLFNSKCRLQKLKHHI